MSNEKEVPVGAVIEERAGALGQVADTMVAEPVEIVGHVESPGDVINAVKRGLQVRVFDQLCSELNIPTSRLLQVVGMSDSTLRRRRVSGRLDQNESERVYRLGKLFHLATRVLGSRELAGQWFKMPATALGGSTPLDYADTEIGKREVEKVLYRIAYGIVS
jgi:putative toxin-antitoxin system antitoxin component (TIGR02293 family)